MKTAYLGLGSNLGDREGNLRAALERLDAPGLRVQSVSPTYETEPVGFAAQRWFLNLVAKIETGLFPMQLLARAHRIERELGRVRGVLNGPRTIDIDILLYGTAVVHSTALEIPHPRMAERRFVLAPLADLDPELRHPVTRQTIARMLAAAPPQNIHKHAGAEAGNG